jgi:hypothetical protein
MFTELPVCLRPLRHRMGQWPAAHHPLGGCERWVKPGGHRRQRVLWQPARPDLPN